MLKIVILPKEALKGLRKAVKAGVRGEYPDRNKGTPKVGQGHLAVTGQYRPGWIREPRE